jgi:hypothetical protein
MKYIIWNILSKNAENQVPEVREIGGGGGARLLCKFPPFQLIISLLGPFSLMAPPLANS